MWFHLKRLSCSISANIMRYKSINELIFLKITIKETEEIKSQFNKTFPFVTGKRSKNLKCKKNKWVHWWHRTCALNLKF